MRSAMFSVLTSVILMWGASAQAATFSNWDLNGSAALIDGGNTVRLTANQASQVGVTWGPGSLDLGALLTREEKKPVEVFFDFRVTGTGVPSNWGDGFAVFVSSQAPLATASGAFGLNAFDDGMAFLIDPAANKALSRQAGATSDPTTTLAASKLKFGADKVDMLDSTLVHARLQFSWVKDKGWTLNLSMDGSRPGEAWRTFATSTVSQSTFSDWSDVRIGFGASTLGGERANFDILSFSAQDMRYPAAPVPEASTMALAMAGLGVLAWSARRRRVAAGH